MEENKSLLEAEKCIEAVAEIKGSVWAVYKTLLKNDKKNVSPNLREFIIAVRETLGITQEQMARLFDTKQNAFSRYEKGARRVPIDVYAGAWELLGYDLVMKKREAHFGKDDEFVKEYEEEKKQW
jgi:DNA-binding transcriptional regulator YiaG